MTTHNFIDRAGERYHWLVCLEPVREKGKPLRWLCRCDCGSLVTVITSGLIRGDRKSCSTCMSERSAKSRASENPAMPSDGFLIVHVGSRSYPQAKMLIDTQYESIMRSGRGGVWISKPAADLAYAFRRDELGKKISIHREVIGALPGQIVDHINGNTLDNRAENLRIATREQNNRNACISKNNTSGKSGVCWHVRVRMWQARISVNGQKVHLGYFDDIGLAIAAREKAEEDYGYHVNHGRRRDYFPPR